MLSTDVAVSADAGRAPAGRIGAGVGEHASDRALDTRASNTTVSSGPPGVLAVGLPGSRGSTPACARSRVICCLTAMPPPLGGSSMPNRPGPTLTVSPLAVRPTGLSDRLACGRLGHAACGRVRPRRADIDGPRHGAGGPGQSQRADQQGERPVPASPRAAIRSSRLAKTHRQIVTPRRVSCLTLMGWAPTSAPRAKPGREAGAVGLRHSPDEHPGPSLTAERERERGGRPSGGGAQLHDPPPPPRHVDE
jgi:hypothetical protein